MRWKSCIDYSVCVEAIHLRVIDDSPTEIIDVSQLLEVSDASNYFKDLQNIPRLFRCSALDFETKIARTIFKKRKRKRQKEKRNFSRYSKSVLDYWTLSLRNSLYPCE
ncbi:hypothetical protein CEXT_203611 [Caerostris extrusa]|uniref:Uncharacterized protein n=1 Tax=Caerostris extrusa TaxID=172846 RepID=A0AAV4N3K8_CAEEX|nr:hypothetical protein CEXT_203611 [Caerostris extrusa]